MFIKIGLKIIIVLIGIIFYMLGFQEELFIYVFYLYIFIIVVKTIINMFTKSIKENVFEEKASTQFEEFDNNNEKHEWLFQ